VGIPLIQQVRVGAYILGKRLRGVEKYPLVLMLEPLFRCNLACPGCGKIDYRGCDPQQAAERGRNAGMRSTNAARRSFHSRRRAADPQGDRRDRSRHRRAQEVRLRSAPTACCWKRSSHLFSRALSDLSRSISTALREHHDKAVSQKGVFDKAVKAIKAAQDAGFAVNVNATIFDGIPPRTLPRSSITPRSLTSACRFRRAMPMSARPIRRTFSIGKRPRSCSARCSRSGRAAGSSCTPRLFLDFLAGNQEYECTPWGNARAQYLRLAEALLSARRGLYRDLQGADGNHQLGFLRHRQLREVRGLHGALRL
jgi:hypothetical protein